MRYKQNTHEYSIVQTIQMLTDIIFTDREFDVLDEIIKTTNKDEYYTGLDYEAEIIHRLCSRLNLILKDPTL